MKTILKENTTFVLRFDKGEELFSSLCAFCKENHIASGSFFAIGATEKIVISFYDGINKKYLDKTIDSELEIIALNGIIALLDNVVMSHAHGSFSFPDMTLLGGHMKELYVGSTTEVVLTSFTGVIVREFNEDIGLNLMKDPPSGE